MIKTSLARITVVSVVLLFTLSYAEAEFESSFSEANRLYENEQYDKAIEKYSELLMSGYESGNLYYNLGNSYFKLGEIGRAILNYERAKRIMPDDRDLSSNYEYARSLIKGDVKDVRKAFAIRVLNSFLNKFSIDGITIFSSLCYVFILIVLILSFYIPVLRKYRIYAILVLSIIFIISMASLYRRINLISREAIVISDEAEANFEPFERATAHFVLYEGMKIYILGDKDDWYKIKRSDGKIGWVKKSDIGII